MAYIGLGEGDCVVARDVDGQVIAADQDGDDGDAGPCFLGFVASPSAVIGGGVGGRVARAGAVSGGIRLAGDVRPCSGYRGSHSLVELVVHFHDEPLELVIVEVYWVVT